MESQKNIDDKRLITGITLEESQERAQEILETIVLPQNKEYERKKNLGH